MIKLETGTFFDTLLNIFEGSPSSILFIILGIIFTLAMIINIKKNKKIGKTLYIIGWIFIISFIVIRYNSYLSKIFDNLINQIFMQIFFPNLATYVILIIITNIIFLISINRKNIKNLTKVINSIFFIVIMIMMVYTLEQIISNNINIYSTEEVYTNQNVLVLIESTTILFTIWTVILISKFIISKLIKKSDEKIIEEYQEKQISDNSIKKVEKPNIIPENESNNIEILNTNENSSSKNKDENSDLKDYIRTDDTAHLK